MVKTAGTKSQIEKIKDHIKAGICTYSIYENDVFVKTVMFKAIGITTYGKVLAIKDDSIFLPDEIAYHDRKEKLVGVRRDAISAFCSMDTKHNSVEKAVKMYNEAIAILDDSEDLVIDKVYDLNDIINEENLLLNQMISNCNARNTRQSVGEILKLSEENIIKILNEFDKKCDIRFGDNLIYACGIVKRLRQDWNYSAIFRD